ncbi:MAG: 30S ribosomal protein S11 [Candidatus Liptonbacteria bacterium]|nr:30S ribosomal protein S11 [Candidatus Liptonbacteria bacterium]
MGKKKVAQPKAEAAAPGKGEAPRAEKAEGAKKGKRLSRARVYIKASYNNTVVSVTDMEGNVVTWASAGSLGFSGPKKATPFASSKIIATIAERLKNSGLKDVDVLVRGIGSGRDSAIRSLVGHGFNVLSIKEVTGIPHNGPRPKKVRRV